MYTLYYSPGACSLAIHALLHSLAVPFETVCVELNKSQNRAPDYLAINPRGQVPVLIEDGKTLRESAVIAVHLLDKHQSPLLPAGQWERLKALEWLGYYNTVLQQAYGGYFLMDKNLKDEAAKDAACALSARRIAFLWRDVEAQLAGKTYLCGEAVTIADLFHAVIANWTRVLAHKVELGPNTLRLCKTVVALPYFAKALMDENISYGQ